MSEAKYAPGPWAIQYIECDIMGQPYYIHQCGDQGSRICDIRGWGHLTGTGGNALALNSDDAIKIQRANAHLIAAAPDLLEALESLSNWAGSLGLDLKSNDCNFLLDVAEKAIAKAKGKTT